MKMRLYSYMVFWVLFSYSCEDVLVSNESPVPQISIISIAPSSVRQFLDSVTIRISYKDGDGDLGDFSADSLNIFVKDSRLNAWDRYHLPPLAPENTTVSIEGVFNLQLKNLFLLSNSNSENVYFEVYLKDRKGNRSNIAKTNALDITK